MPWTASDVDRFKKGLSKKQKKKWAAIANGALTSCMEGGADEKECAGRAVRIANAKFSENETVTDYPGVFNPVIPENFNLKIETKAEEKIEENKLKEKNSGEIGECEMEIFRAGNHNGDDFTEKDLEQIAGNFHALKNDLRPKLKITHHGEEEEQKSIAGLASYGDVTDVFMRSVDGAKRLFAKLSNVPNEVLSWIKDRRFPERSIELYPKFKLGTDKNSPIYKNVLKAIALLGHEMPAVPGMAPIMLEECLECQGTKCFLVKFDSTPRLECPNCKEMVPESKVKDSKMGTTQCPKCGTMITPDGIPEKEASMMSLSTRMENLNTEVENILLKFK